jgi:integrase
MLIRNKIRDFKVYCKNAGIKTKERLHPHCLRKGWACNLTENGISPKTLCELARKRGCSGAIASIERHWVDSSPLDEFSMYWIHFT